MRRFFTNALAAAVLGCCTFGTAVYAGPDSSVDIGGFHKYESLGVKVLTHGNSENVAAVINDPSVNIFVLQIPFQEFDASCSQDIMDWVRSGHSLWFYDSRYAPYFGMKTYALAADQFKGQDHEGEIGSSVYKGKAAGVMTFSKHETASGVGQCTIFIPEVERGVYSAVACEGDSVPLLQFAADSPALAAVRRDGKGAVIFKPLLWPESSSGKRFQNNLLEYSAGYAVPGMGGEGRVGEYIGKDAQYIDASAAYASSAGASGGRVYAKSLDGKAKNQEGSFPGEFSGNKNINAGSSVKGAEYLTDSRINLEAAKNTSEVSKITESSSASEVNAAADGGKVDVVTLRNGKKYVGFCRMKEIHLETTSDSFKASPDQFTEIVLTDNNWSLDKVSTKNGNNFSGYMITNDFYFSNADGPCDFKKSDIKSIRFGVPAEEAYK